MAGIPQAPTAPSGAPPSGSGTNGQPPTIPAGTKVARASAGDCLCKFAADNGFRDCNRLRQANPNLADNAVLEDGTTVQIPKKQEKQVSDSDKSTVKCKRVEYGPGKVKFLTQTSSLGVAAAAGATRLGISNYITNKAGADGNGTVDPFFAGKGAETAAAMTADEKKTFADPDHFRVEVHDVVAGKKNQASIKVELQVLQPLYKRAVVQGKNVIKRDKTKRSDPDVPPGFKIPANPKRKMEVECFRVGKTNFYRSRYLRLVTHAEDDVPDQTLFVGDYYDDGAGDFGANDAAGKNDEKWYTEILHQKVRARYTPFMCDPKKCRSEALADVGELRNEARLVVHILDNCISFEDARRVVYKQVRRTYAQAHIRPNLKAILKHPAPKNILTIGSPNGTGSSASGLVSRPMNAPRTAAGGSKIIVKVDGKTITQNLTRDASIANVTAALSAAITAQGLFVKSLKHAPKTPPVPPLETSRDILIYRDKDLTKFAEITSVTCDDTRMSASFTPLTPALLGAFPQDDERHEHRVLKAACETKWFDSIIIKSFAVEDGSILFGIATWFHLPFGPCFIVESARMVPAQDPRYTYSHEMGHCVMHCGHCLTSAEKEQLMVIGSKAGGTNAFDMPGRRRIMDGPLQVKYQVLNPDGSFPGLKTLEAGGKFGTAVSRCNTFLSSSPFGDPLEPEPDTEW